MSSAQAAAAAAAALRLVRAAHLSVSEFLRGSRRTAMPVRLCVRLLFCCSSPERVPFARVRLHQTLGCAFVCASVSSLTQNGQRAGHFLCSSAGSR